MKAAPRPGLARQNATRTYGVLAFGLNNFCVGVGECCPVEFTGKWVDGDIFMMGLRFFFAYAFEYKSRECVFFDIDI